MTQFIFNDGGRSAAGYKGRTSDCAVRAVCLATGAAYKDVYAELARRNAIVRGVRSVRHGTPTKTLRAYLQELGWHWCPAPHFTGRKARPKDLPPGTVIARQARHIVAVIDGCCHDTFDSSEKMVYGYWKKL